MYLKVKDLGRRERGGKKECGDKVRREGWGDVEKVGTAYARKCGGEG